MLLKSQIYLLMDHSHTHHILFMAWPQLVHGTHTEIWKTSHLVSWNCVTPLTSVLVMDLRCLLTWMVCLPLHPELSFL
eukprot:8936674-Karenia_brevis.AAC.1